MVVSNPGFSIINIFLSPQGVDGVYHRVCLVIMLLGFSYLFDQVSQLGVIIAGLFRADEPGVKNALEPALPRRTHFPAVFLPAHPWK